MRTTGLFTLGAIALGVAASAAADDHEMRHHDAHQHGKVEWYIAQDNNMLLVEMTAPGSDIVGFEHAPENDAQRAAIQLRWKNSLYLTRCFQ